MITDEQVASKMDMGAIVKAQAKLRASLGLAIIVGGLALLLYRGVPNPLVGYMVAAHAFYIISIGILAIRLRPVSAEQLALATAILDPLILTAWLPLIDELGGLVVGFYLFTILGFGFRISRKLMQVCQAASIAGFIAVLAIEPFWRANYIVWLSFLVVLIVVPLYAGGLVKKLHQARAHAERESQAKSQLLAKVSHELRTPLSGIVAAAELLLGDAGDKQVSKRAGTILSLSNDLLREINDLLDQAKHEAKGLMLESAPFDLEDQMQRIRHTLESTASKKGIDLLTSVDPCIQTRILGDSHYLSRVLINLAGNAVKFTEKGKVEISAKLLEDHANHYEVRFSVRDTGIGISSELHSRIFEPFFQVDGGTARQYGGTGLGMAIAKEIITLMGGEIRVESELGKGSRFYFDLRFPKVEVLEPPSAGAVNIVHGKHVLVADDNETNLTLIKELLEQDGHAVTGVRSGQEALTVLSAEDFDVIFLDFNMGDMDGAKVLQLYRFGHLNPVPAFFLTADATATTAEKLRDTGAAGVLNKPITTEGLRLAISQVVAPDTRRSITTLATPVQATLAAVPTQHINLEVIEELKSISDRPKFLAELLGNASEDIERNCIDLAKAWSRRDYEDVHDIAHALKGVCASVGAGRLEWLANKLMRMPAEELEQPGERLKTDITETARLTVAAIRNIVLNRAATN